jgi:hypothetical protein
MTITFENENDVIIYALEKIISFTRNHHYICLGQSVSWITSILRFQSGLVIHIDTLRIRRDIGKPESLSTSLVDQEVLNSQKKQSAVITGIEHYIHPSELVRILELGSEIVDSQNESTCTTETNIHNEVIKNFE